FVRIGLVTPDFFPVLGVQPQAGRLFEAKDDVEGPPATILLSHALWQRRFGGDRGIVGRAITVNERPVQVVGVLPESFRLLFPQGAGIPDSVEAYQLLDPRIAEGPRGQRYLRVVGRMKPSVSVVEARQEVDRLAAELAREFPSPDGLAFVTVPLAKDITKTVREPIVMGGAGGGLVV